MDGFIFLIFRRMRRPLITLVVVYAVAILGMVLIPGRDGDGNPVHMSFFHAFYFISYTATTIGFGEIPYAFTDGQRLWVTLSIYATVIGWFYAIGNVLALIQDKSFQHALTELRFTHRIRHLREPFYLIAGYGQTGRELALALTSRNQHVVVLDKNEERINHIQLENLPEPVPGLKADARRPTHLIEAGLRNRMCAGVVALTDNNEANLKIAITAKLLRPNMRVICRADSHDVEANMASFGTDYIIDPFDTFALHLAIALESPGQYLLREWLAGVEHSDLNAPVYPPTEGTWVICGYGRFGKAIYQRLKKQGLNIVVVEAQPEQTGRPPDGVVVGRGTEAKTLVEAGIRDAVGLVAGTDNDANNLSIIMTARELNTRLFVVARQNHRDNQALFDAVGADIVMHPSAIIANRIRVLLSTPLLHEFMQLAKLQDDDWACELISRIIAVVTDKVPTVWELRIGVEQARAVNARIKQQSLEVRLEDLLRRPNDRERLLRAIPLMLKREGSRTMLPSLQTRLKSGDLLLFCGRDSARAHMRWILQHDHVLSYVATGEVPAQGSLMRWLEKRRRAVAAK